MFRSQYRTSQGGVEIARELPDKAGWSETVLRATQAQTAYWMQRRTREARMGQMRAKAPTMKECIEQIRKRLNAELADIK